MLDTLPIGLLIRPAELLPTALYNRTTLTQLLNMQAKEGIQISKEDMAAIPGNNSKKPE